MIAHYDRLVETVQANCHITDARHAREMTLCTYLLEMREFYRWERGAAQTAQLARTDVAEWLSGREALWSAVEDAEYRPLSLDGNDVEPFDVDTMNRVLVPCNLVYGAGIGRFGKPQFFVGVLAREEWRDGIRILVARREHARDVAPAAAAFRDGTIYLRLESLRRVLWEKAEAWGIRRPDGPMMAALAAYDFARDAEAALEQMATAESEALILHEMGECRAGCLLGAQWEAMLCSFSERRAELLARAARDHLADCLVTLPALLERDAAPSLHFWFANLEGMRRLLFPRMISAYAAWRGGDHGCAIRDAAEAGVAHWQRLCMQVLALHAGDAAAAQAVIAALASDAGSRL